MYLLAKSEKEQRLADKATKSGFDYSSADDSIEIIAWTNDFTMDDILGEWTGGINWVEIQKFGTATYQWRYKENIKGDEFLEGDWLRIRFTPQSPDNIIEITGGGQYFKGVIQIKADGSEMRRKREGSTIWNYYYRP